MLDSSAMTYLLEGGHGWDPEGGKDNQTFHDITPYCGRTLIN